MNLLTVAGICGMAACAIGGGRTVGSDTPAATGISVEIVGGPDKTGHNYEWTVRNHHSSAIVYVAFPHFRADLFFVPQGWSTAGTSNLKGMGAKRSFGTCVGRVERWSQGIAPGGEGVFKMRVDGTRARPAPGTVLIRFADGSEHLVSQVLVPSAEATSDKLVPLFGLAGVFIVLILTAMRRRAR
ncbi:MAG: hypothetical protein ACE5E5_05945 [Phycisphaerae bacterium]